MRTTRWPVLLDCNRGGKANAPNEGHYPADFLVMIHRGDYVIYAQLGPCQSEDSFQYRPASLHAILVAIVAHFHNCWHPAMSARLRCFLTFRGCSKLDLHRIPFVSVGGDPRAFYTCSEFSTRGSITNTEVHKLTRTATRKLDW